MRCGSAVSVLIAEEEPTRCQVPALVDARVDSAASQILERRRLRLGRIERRPDSRPKGTIIEQSPSPGSYVLCGSPVNVLVAVPFPADTPPVRVPVDVVVTRDPDCKVPPLVGREEKQAIELISAAQLRAGNARRQESDQVVGTILAQSVAPGTIVKCDTTIDVVIAQHVTRVPSLSGNDIPAAGRRLTQSGLRLGKTLERESTTAPGTVVDQMPAANTIVNPDSPVDVWVAIRKPVLVPDLQGQDRATAGQTLADMGLNLVELGKRESTENAGSVVGQVPAPNTSVRFGAAVGVWLAIPVPPPPVAWVPSLTGVAQTEALGLIGNAKLTPGAVSQRESSQTPGTVLDQRPTAGAQVPPGTAVDFTLAIPVRKSIVPDLVGQRQTGAAALLTRNTLRIGGVLSRTSDEPAGVIVDQRPAAGRQVDPGSTVDVWVAAPPQPVVSTPIPPTTVTVPDLIGSSQNGATASIQNLKLRVGRFGERESSEPRGTVVAQDPPAGTVVDAGSPVSVWLAIPIVPAPVPTPTLPADDPWWDLAPQWLGSGALFMLAAAITATVKRVRRNRISSAPTLVPHVDAGVQFSAPGDRDLTNFAIALEARRDRGVQTLDCPEEFIAGYWSGKQELSW